MLIKKCSASTSYNTKNNNFFFCFIFFYQQKFIHTNTHTEKEILSIRLIIVKIGGTEVFENLLCKQLVIKSNNETTKFLFCMLLKIFVCVKKYNLFTFPRQKP